MKNDLHTRHELDVMNCYLVTARGNEMWDLRWVDQNKPLIPRGRDGAFDNDFIQPAIHIVTFDDRHWLFYSGARERHGIGKSRGTSVGLAFLRLDGFVCFEAGSSPGFVETKPFRVEGRHLEVNADTAGGELVVEVLDAAGRVLDGFSRRDAEPHQRGAGGVRLRPSWTSHESLSTLLGKTVRLRFHLRDAKLYAFKII